MTSKARKNSRFENGLFNRMGSRIQVNKEAVAIIHSAKETLEYLMLPKKQIQCAATNAPVPIIALIFFRLTDFIVFQNLGITKKLRLAIIILYHTNGPSSRLIRRPSMPVKPKIKIARCNWTKAL